MVWWLVVKASGVRAEQHRRSDDDGARSDWTIAADAVCAIGLVVGLLIGVAAWRWLRTARWSVVLVVLVCATAAASPVAGRLPSSGDFSARLAAASQASSSPFR